MCEGYDEKHDYYLGRDEFGRMGYFKGDKTLVGKFVQLSVTKTKGISLYGDVVSIKD